MRFKLSGIIPAMVTPFTKDGEQVDYAKVAPIAEKLIQFGAKGIFVAGTTGEGFLLTPEEREGLLEEVIDTVGKRAMVIAQTGAAEYWTTLQLTEHAAKAGASAAGIIAPFFYRYDDEAIYAYYAKLAGAMKGYPIILYNLPGCAGNSISPDVTMRLADKFDNIVGIKDSSGDMSHLSLLLARAPKGFQVCNGCDPYGFQAYVAGASGAVSGTANVAGDLLVKVFDLVAAGKLTAAWKAQEKVIQLCEVLQYGRHLALFKEAMRLRGVDAGYVRSPQRELNAAEKKKLEAAMREAGLL
jgi:4-hydroxy-tetrahydrodipicolinate synthase